MTRSDWTRDDIASLFDLPFTELVFRAAEVHRAHHAANEVQLSTLLSIKTGGCPEDCGYCSQSSSHETGLKATKLMDVRAVLQAAAEAKDNGSSRVVTARDRRYGSASTPLSVRLESASTLRVLGSFRHEDRASLVAPSTIKVLPMFPVCFVTHVPGRSKEFGARRSAKLTAWIHDIFACWRMAKHAVKRSLV